MKKEDVQKRVEEIKDITRPPLNPTYRLSREEREKVEKRLGIRPKK